MSRLSRTSEESRPGHPSLAQTAREAGAGRFLVRTAAEQAAYREAIENAGLRIELIRENPYEFISERAYEFISARARSASVK